jgi:8-oxo-dGTP pyrophosphatase MutT (NUDIX family)
MENKKLKQLLENFVPQGEQELSDLPIFREFAEQSRSLTRDSVAHFTASAFVLNEKHDKLLAIFHKIYQNWGWLGGHSDGQEDLLAVALREVHEESGLSQLKVLHSAPISLEVITVPAHVHRTYGYVSAHLHLNVTFLIEADEKEVLHKNEAETEGIAWVPISEFITQSNEAEMKPIYEKIILRIEALK